MYTGTPIRCFVSERILYQNFIKEKNGGQKEVGWYVQSSEEKSPVNHEFYTH